MTSATKFSLLAIVVTIVSLVYADVADRGPLSSDEIYEVSIEEARKFGLNITIQRLQDPAVSRIELTVAEEKVCEFGAPSLSLGQNLSSPGPEAIIDFENLEVISGATIKNHLLGNSFMDVPVNCSNQDIEMGLPFKGRRILSIQIDE